MLLGAAAETHALPTRHSLYLLYTGTPMGRLRYMTPPPRLNNFSGRRYINTVYRTSWLYLQREHTGISNEPRACQLGKSFG